MCRIIDSEGGQQVPNSHERHLGLEKLSQLMRDISKLKQFVCYSTGTRSVISHNQDCSLMLCQWDDRRSFVTIVSIRICKDLSCSIVQTQQCTWTPEDIYYMRCP